MPAKYRGPNVVAIMRFHAKQYLREAGEIIATNARSKIGTYQPGWPPLSRATLARRARKKKSFRRMMHNRGQVFGPGYSSDTPLMDTGKMARGISHFERGMETRVSAPFPMQVHEQDDEIEAVSGRFLPPRRPVMGPAFDESMPQIERGLVDYVARMF